MVLWVHKMMNVCSCNRVGVTAAMFVVCGVCSTKLQGRVRELEEAVDTAHHERRMAELDQAQLRAQFERALAVQKVCMPV